MRTNFVPAAVTGENIFADPMQPAFGARDEHITLGYALDAPELVPVGGAKAVVIQGILEAVTPRTAPRC